MTKEKAIKELRSFLGQLTEGCQEAIKVLIPELQESEDERIRKAIVEFFKLQDDNTTYSFIPKKSILAWLEKQKDAFENGRQLGIMQEQARQELELTDEKQKAVKTPQWMIDFLNDIRTASINKEGYDDYDGRREYEGKILAIIRWLEGNFIQQKEQKTRNDGIREKIISRATSEKQVVLISASNGKAEIGWDTRSLEDTKKLLEYGLAFINRNITNPTEKQTDYQQKQKPSEWSEEDEKKRNLLIDILEVNHPNGYFKVNPANTLNMEAIHVEELVDWLKSLRPQPKRKIYQAAKHDLAIRFMNYLDENRPEGKMSLSEGECGDIDKAFKENDWAKIMRYAEKYQILQEKKPEVKLKGWVARDRDEKIWVYRDHPEFETQEWMPSGSRGTMLLDQKSFPDLKWEDEPVEVEITIKRR